MTSLEVLSPQELVWLVPLIVSELYKTELVGPQPFCKMNRAVVSPTNLKSVAYS